MLINIAGDIQRKLCLRPTLTFAEGVHVIDVNGRFWHDLSDVLTPTEGNRSSELHERSE